MKQYICLFFQKLLYRSNTNSVVNLKGRFPHYIYINDVELEYWTVY